MFQINKKIITYSVALAAVLNTSYLSAASKDTKKTKVDFNEILIDAPYKLIQPVLAADIIENNAKELIVLGTDENKDKWLITYLFNDKKNEYAISNRLVIPKQFYSYDLSDYQSGLLQNLYFMSSNELVKYDAINNQFKTIAAISSIFLKDAPEHINRGHFIKDFNQDKIDDVLVSDFSSTHILIGQKDGQFTKQALPIAAEVNLLSDGATYKQAKLYFEDINFDSTIDIIQVGEGQMQVYPQTRSGIFNTQPNKVEINKAISGTEWWNKRDETGESLDQSELIYRKLEELRDLNSDGITDMIVRFTKVSGVLDRVNDYEIYLGTNNKGQLSYPEKPNSTIRADGTLTGLEFVDIDNDNKSEVMLAGFDIGMSQIIGALLAGSIDQDVYLFKMNGEDNYQKAQVSKEVELNFSLSSGQSGSAVVKLGDLDGDGLKDLILSDGDDELKIYLGDTSKRLFKKRAQDYDTQLPQDGNLVYINDLSHDGKDDLLIKFSKKDENSSGKNFKVLMSL